MMKTCTRCSEKKLPKNTPPFDNAKQCPCCKQWFPRTLEYFIKQKNVFDNVGSYCKPCSRQKKREAYAANPEYSKEYVARKIESIGRDAWNEKKRAQYHAQSHEVRARVVQTRTVYKEKNKIKIAEDYKVWVKTPKGQSACRRAKARYKKTDAGKASEERYIQGEAGQATLKRARRSPAGKARSRRGEHKRRARKLNAMIGYVDEQSVYDFCGNRCAY